MAEVFDVFDYNELQQFYCHNAASNVVGQLRGTEARLQAAMQRTLADLVPEIERTWSVAWGPAVYKRVPQSDLGGAENAWYIAKNDDTRVCVVAIAGTALWSLAWLGDIDVSHIVPFDDWTAKWTDSSIPPPPETTWKADDPRSLCSRGTAEFVHNVLRTRAPKNSASPGTTIVDFLRKLQEGPTQYRIVFTGHSLGGAVSPAVAHGLVQAKLIKPDGVNVLPTAGASPGNANWNTSFSGNFPRNDPYNAVLFNHLDVVPQAWSIDPASDRNINNITKRIYTQLPTTLQKILQGFVNKGIDRAKKGMPYAPLPGDPFEGPKIRPIRGPIGLYKSLGLQHSPVYWQRIGIQAFVDKFKRRIAAQPDVEPLPGAPDFDGDVDSDDDDDAYRTESEYAKLERQLKNSDT